MINKNFDQETFEDLFPGLKRKSQILTDSWVVSLGQQQETEAMENDYKAELNDLQGIYGATIEKFDAVYGEKLERIVQYMADFVDCHQARKQYRKKLAILQAKLTTEEGSDDEDCDEDECCC
jgi:hypothetical protein